MEKYELMHSMFGECNGQCWDCHFCHWNIESNGKNKSLGYVWCEIYGIDKNNTSSTRWCRKFPACGLLNLDHYPKNKNIFKYAKQEKEVDEIGQLRLF